MIEVGAPIVLMGLRPYALLVRLPLLSFSAPYNPEDDEQ